MLTICHTLRKALLGLLLGLFPLHALAQDGPLGALNMGAPTPTAAALGTYGDTPVSLYTGTPNIRIPLTAVEGRTLSLPVALRYDAGGVKVDAASGWVGQGWVLEAGGVITRSLRALPDDTPKGYYHTGGRLEALKDLDWGDLTVRNADALAYLADLETYQVDPEPDRFYFNIGGRAGSFVLTKALGGDQPDIRTIPHSRLRIEPHFETISEAGVTAYAGVAGWTVTDEAGTRYIFEAREWTRDLGDGYKPYYISSWYLTRIESAMGEDAITLHYSGHQEVQHPQRGYEEQYYFLNGQCQIGPRETQVMAVRSFARTLTAITAARSHVSLLSEGVGPDQVLRRIEVQTPQGDRTRQFAFAYEDYGVRRYLASVQEHDATGTLHLPPYQFTYDQPEHLPAVGSPAVDHWGYYNAQKNAAGTIPYLYYVDPATAEQYFMEGHLADRSPNPTVATVGTLTSITYPTGGRTTFQYEAHTYGKVGTVPVRTAPVRQSSDRVSALEGSTDRTAFTVGGTERVLVTVTYTLKLADGFTQEHCSGGYCAALFIHEAGVSHPLYAFKALTGGGFVDRTRQRGCGGGGFCIGGGRGGYQGFRDQVVLFIALPPGAYELVARTKPGDHAAQGQVRWIEDQEAQERLAGGLRVRRVEQHDGLVGEDGTPHPPIVITYRYTEGEGGRSSGVLAAAPRYHYINDWRVGTGASCRFIALAAMPRGPLQGLPGATVGYGEVRAYTPSGGWTTHRFATHRARHDAPRPVWNDEEQWPFGSHTSDHWRQGVLLGKAHHEAIGSLLQTQIYIQGMADEQQADPDPRTTRDLPALAFKRSLQSKSGSYNTYLRRYDVIASWLYPVAETIIHQGNPATARTRSFTYSPDHLQVTKATETTASGLERHTLYAYAHEAHQPAMAEANMLSQVYAVSVQDASGNDLEKQWTVWGQADGYWRPRESWAWQGPGQQAPAAPGAVCRLPSPATQAALCLGQMVRYDQYGQLMERYDALGQPLQVTYNQDHTRIVAIERPGGLGLQFNHYTAGHRHGLLAQMTDEAGATVSFDYDTFGRLARRTDGTGSEATYRYHLAGPTIATHPNHIERAQKAPGTARTSRTYLDGLGREVQTQVLDEAHTGQYVVTHRSFDASGKPWKHWKPFRALTGNRYMPAPMVRDQARAAYGMAQSPFTETRYEASPLGRIHQIIPPHDQPTPAVTYAYGTDGAHLFVQTADEEGQTQRTYTDALGRTVREQVGLAVTTFAFDLLDQVVRVIDPDGKTTAYTYDAMRRVTGVATPDGDGDGDGDPTNENAPYGVDVRYAYDASGQVRLSQDPNEHAAGVVRVTQYDGYRRPTAVGQVREAFGQLQRGDQVADEQRLSALQYETLDTGAYPWSHSRLEGVTLSHTQGRLAAAAVRVAPDSLLTTRAVVFDLFQGSEDLRARDLVHTNRLLMTGGQLRLRAGREVRLMPGVHIQAGSRFVARIDTSLSTQTEGWLYTAYGYDPQGRITAVYQDVGAEVGLKTIRYGYDEAGQLQTIQYQPGEADAFYHWHDYDDAGRLKQVWTHTQPDKATAVAEVGYAHRPTGQVDRLYVGPLQAPLQVVHKGHNLRDWITSIQGERATGTPGVFSMQLGYTPDVDAPPGAGSYRNGNIAWQRWQTSPGHVPASEGGYTYTYDAQQRLTKADYLGYKGSWQQAQAFDLPALAYSGNGSILSLQRRDDQGQLDQMVYTYMQGSNRLVEVGGSLGGKQTHISFAYDYNGNLTKGRGLRSIAYDHRNLPTEVSLERTGATLQFQYDAEGLRVYKGLLGEDAGQYSIRGSNGRVLAVYNRQGQLRYWNILGAGEVIGRAMPKRP